MSKAALSLAERLAQLRQIPNHMLPATLKHKILLPKFTELKFEANRNAKELGPIFSFYRKYVPDIRFHNSQLKVSREISELGPLIARISIRKGEGEPYFIEGAKYKSPEELKARIIEYHNTNE